MAKISLTYKNEYLIRTKRKTEMEREQELYIFHGVI